MNFNKDFYKKEKAIVIELIEKSPEVAITDGFVADGIINPDIYQEEQQKVLVILAESYGYDTCGHIEIEDQQHNDILGLGKSDVQTPRKIATLLWLLFKSLEKDKKIDFEDFLKLELFKINDANYLELQSILSKIAWINVRKASKQVEENGTRQKWLEIYNSAFANEEIITRQIKSIAPSLIIVCSSPVFDSLNEMELLGTGIADKKYEIQINNNGQRIIYVKHPSYFRDWSYEGIYGTFEIIYNSLCLGKLEAV